MNQNPEARPTMGTTQDRDPRPRGRVLLAALLLCSAGCRQCGPTPEEWGGAVLLASPLVFLGGLAVLAIFAFLWRPLRPEARMRWRPLAATFAVLLGLAGWGGAVTGAGGADWMGFALMMGFALTLFGASYIALLLVVSRIWLEVRPAAAFTWSPIAVLAVLLLPAPPLMLEGGRDLTKVAISMWVLPGSFGQVTVAVALILMIELIVRRVRHAKAARHAELSDQGAQGGGA